MNHTLRHWGPIGLVVGAIIFASSLSRAEPQTRTLSRTEDHILFTGADAPSLIGSEVRDLHLYAYGHSGFRAIPFQVDKRDAENRYVFPREKARDPMRDGTSLDLNDEMVFMVKDAGDKCRENCWNKSAANGVEIEILDPLDGARAWVYIFERPGAEPPKTDEYVSYQVKGVNEFVSSNQYEIGKPLDLIGYDSLKLKRPDGSWGKDILVSQTSWMGARLLNGSIPIYVPIQESKSKTIGVIDGPIRVIRDEIRLIKIKVIGLEIFNESFLVYYGNGQINPTNINIPVSIRKIFIEANFYWALVFTEAVTGSIYLSQANPEGILLDMKPLQDVDINNDNSYMAVTGPQGSMIDIIDLGDFKVHDTIRTSLVYEDFTRKSPARYFSGKMLAGIIFKNTKKIPKGTYRYWFYHYYPYPFTEDKVQEVLNMIDHPVETKVFPITSPEAVPEG